MSAVSPLIQRIAAVILLVLVFGLAFNTARLALAHRTSLREEIAFLAEREAQLARRAVELASLESELTALEKTLEGGPSFPVYANGKEAEGYLHRSLRALAQVDGLQLLQLNPGGAAPATGPIRAQVRLLGREQAALAFVRGLFSGSPRIAVSRLALTLQQRIPDPANLLVQVEADVEFAFRVEK